MVTASKQGFDGAMRAVHRWQRSLAAHPKKQLVTLNVWEAVLFEHDIESLIDIARKAAEIGVERFVLDDGWFHLRRSDNAGLGDWWVDRDIWPNGLGELADVVHECGMEFGIWIEPEMINPDSDTFRANPHWAMGAGSRQPILERNQLVLDLSNPQAYQHVIESITAVLQETAIDFVKWDHNRRILEGGSALRGNRPAVHQQTEAFYRLHDDLRSCFPHLEIESCASGGGRIDQGVVQKVQRFWASDGTDALSRQKMQYWLLQQVAPEYLGAHISRETSAQTGRSYPLSFRAMTALMYGFGIEWDIREATANELVQLREWIRWYKAHRDLLHTGECVRFDLSDPALLAYGVIAQDKTEVVIFHVQCEESWSNRGINLRVPGLDSQRDYRVKILGDLGHYSEINSAEYLPTAGKYRGAYLAHHGIYLPRCQPETVRVLELKAV
ncbi:alpha-galactosidase [Arcanobacterium hippocoleae]|uniref:alpha-galactosidase n=1 Tax=Arcanobacterium hippocoleae TaxID=149017 RepID=UPI00333F374D